MPVSYSQTTRNTFNRGLLTEFSELNFPNEASVDELNCTLFKAGNRSKRLGIKFEDSFQFSTETFDPETLYGVHTWFNVGENSDIEYSVVQAGSRLLFYQKNGLSFSSNPVKTSFTSDTDFIVNLNNFSKSGGTPSLSHVDVATLQGRLVVVSPQIEAFYIEQDPDDGTFTTTEINFRIRDFKYTTEDRLSLTEPLATANLDGRREYDTANCGWTDERGVAALNAYESNNNQYPPLTLPWYAGKGGGENFSVASWERVFAGNTLIVNGHFILDLFDQNRNAASGFSGVPRTRITDRFSTVTTYAGRLFFAGIDSRVYFTRIIEDFNDVGELYQINDPTAEIFNDLLDTDGGWVNISSANNIKKLHTFGSSVLAFADNGVWRISGVDSVFRATEFSVFKITDEGLAQRQSFVSGQNSVPFWWSYVGIHTLQVTDEGGFVEQNLTKDTIQTFWRDIEGDAKAFVQGEYDSDNTSIFWLYPDNGETTDFKLNNFLILDTDLGAFYPWRISDTTSNTPYVVGATFFNSSGSSDVTFNVVDDQGNQVINNAGDSVVVEIPAGTITSSTLKLLTYNQETSQITFSSFDSIDFLDWGIANYEAFAEAAYDFKGDLGRRKTSPYITVFMRVTETGWEEQQDGITPIRNSSLKVSSFWDFRNTISSIAQQAYRFKYPLSFDAGDLTVWSYPTDVITSRLKLRGRGRVARIRFEGEEGKDFNLLGWETLNAINTNY